MDSFDKNKQDAKNDLNKAADKTAAAGHKAAGAAGASNVVHHDDNPSVGDQVGEAAGGISGVLTGAAIGSVGGPIGTIIGGIAGAIGGWWSGRAVSEAASNMTHDDDSFYKNHYESSSSKMADRSYDDVRPAYQIGHLAGTNPDYASKDFDAIEPDLQKGWTNDVRSKHGDWQSVRGYARDAYQRGRSGSSSSGATATATGSAAYAAGRTADKASDAGREIKQGAENAWEKTKEGAKELGHKMGNAAENVKDRIDGDPTTRPNSDTRY